MATCRGTCTTDKGAALTVKRKTWGRRGRIAPRVWYEIHNAIASSDVVWRTWEAALFRRAICTAKVIDNAEEVLGGQAHYHARQDTC